MCQSQARFAGAENTVTTVIALCGISKLMFFRLCTRAPATTIASAIGVAPAVAAGKAVVAPAGIGFQCSPAKAGPLSTRYAAILKPRSIRRAQSAVNHRQRGTVLVNDWEERLPVAKRPGVQRCMSEGFETCLLPNCPGSRLAQRTFRNPTLNRLCNTT